MGTDGLQDLVRRARAGDREAADALVRRYEARVRAALHRRLAPELRARIDTEDVLQSAWAVSLEGLGVLRFEGEAAFVAWLVRTSERRLIDAVRRHRAKMRDIGRQRPIGAAGGRTGGLTTPPDRAIRSEFGEGLRAAVARLDDRERRVVELRSYQDRSFPEIAEEMELRTPDAARDLYRRALKKMGTLLGEGGKPREPRNA